jgi:hypothetical protein
MNILTHKKKSPRGRIGEIGHSVSVHTAEAGHKVREEFDDMVPKATAAASDVLHAAAHTAAERSRPVRAEAASRGSAALSGLLGEVTPAQIERLSRRNAGRSAKTASAHESRSRLRLLLALAGGTVMWVLWRKRSGADGDPRLEELTQPVPVPEPVHGHVDGFAGP